ncbi:MAG: DM13 domain-containing protein [Pseudonocardiaceae bacterium]
MSQVIEQGRSRRPLRRRPVIWVLLTMMVVLLAVGLWAFEPWRLWTRSTVDETLPDAGVAGAPVAPPAAPGAPPAAPVAPAEPVVLAEGQFVTQEHQTTGVARVIELADGSRFIRLEGFSTSDGPDLHVWLTDQTAGGEWGKYDDGRYLALGELKATDGNQNYVIPPDAGLTGLTSVVIWCDRFNVAFGSAPLAL